MNLASFLQFRHAGRGAAVSSLRRPALVPSGAGCQQSLGAETHRRGFGSSHHQTEPAPVSAKETKGGYFGWLREVFSEEKIRARKESLKDELKRGYVNDIKELRANQGKVFAASDGLWGSEASKPFPALRFVDSDDKPAQVPVAAADGSAKATLVCIAFRNGAEDMLLSWSDPFKSHFAGNGSIRVCELSLVDSALMGSWPFRGMILRGAGPARAPSPDDVPMNPATDYVFHFGETREARKTLRITNMLTGYVFLLDSRGRVRWRGSGMSEQWEVDALLRCSMQLLGDKQ